MLLAHEQVACDELVKLGTLDVDCVAGCLEIRYLAASDKVVDVVNLLVKIGGGFALGKILLVADYLSLLDLPDAPGDFFDSVIQPVEKPEDVEDCSVLFHCLLFVCCDVGFFRNRRVFHNMTTEESVFTFYCLCEKTDVAAGGGFEPPQRAIIVKNQTP